MARIPSIPPLTRRQRQILDFLGEYAEDQGISPTLEEIAQHFGLSKVTVFGHVAELERKGVIERAAPGISRGLRLVTADEAPAAPHSPGGMPTGLPILGTIAAGVPIEAIESPETLELTPFMASDKDVFVLRVRGDSMIEDAICDGDLVVVEKRSTAGEGQIVVAILPGDSGEETTLKRFHREPDGRVRLQPANASLQPLVVDDVTIRGIVIGVVRMF